MNIYVQNICFFKAIPLLIAFSSSSFGLEFSELSGKYKADIPEMKKVVIATLGREKDNRIKRVLEYQLSIINSDFEALAAMDGGIDIFNDKIVEHPAGQNLSSRIVSVKKDGDWFCVNIELVVNGSKVPPEVVSIKKHGDNGVQLMHRDQIIHIYTKR